MVFMTAEAIRDSNPILHDLRHERWLSLGGKGDVPNLGMAHSDCLEEITAEYFEGEPLQSEGFDRLVGFKRTEARLYLISGFSA
jgi:hypothetical protein